MSLPNHRLPGRLPRRLPIGATYVVEGYGGDQGNLRVIARYVILPGGRRINVPADFSGPAAPRKLARPRRGNSKPVQGKRRAAGTTKKFARRRGTG